MIALEVVCTGVGSCFPWRCWFSRGKLCLRVKRWSRDRWGQNWKIFFFLSFHSIFILSLGWKFFHWVPPLFHLNFSSSPIFTLHPNNVKLFSPPFSFHPLPFLPTPNTPLGRLSKACVGIYGINLKVMAWKGQESYVLRVQMVY